MIEKGSQKIALFINLCDKKSISWYNEFIEKMFKITICDLKEIFIQNLKSQIVISSSNRDQKRYEKSEGSCISVTQSTEITVPSARTRH